MHQCHVLDSDIVLELCKTLMLRGRTQVRRSTWDCPGWFFATFYESPIISNYKVLKVDPIKTYTVQGSHIFDSKFWRNQSKRRSY